MKITNTILRAFFAVIIFSSAAFSQEHKTFTLNEFRVDQLSLAKESAEGKSYFQLNEQIFSNPELTRGSILEIQKSDGSVEGLVVLDREEYIPGTVSIRAYKEGAPESIFIATYNKGTFNGVFYDEADTPIYFGYDQLTGENFLSAKNERLEDAIACGIDHTKELIPTPHFHSKGLGYKAKPVDSGSITAAPLIVAEDDSITIDLMIVYTNAAELWANSSSFGNIDGVIAQSINLSQTALNNSKVGARLRLVHAYKTSYDELNDGVDSNARLSRLTQNPANPVFDSEDGHDGFMEEIHGLRDDFGADVVSFLARISDTGGLGWRLGSTGGSPSFAFNLNRVQQVADNYTLIHEIGHNMGNAHSRTQEDQAATNGGGLFQYSVGFQNTGSNYATVMAYPDGLQEAPIFSSPNLTFLGTATGKFGTTTPSDNARSMKEIKRTFSNYRASIVSPPVASVLADVINIEMNREEDLSIPYQIFNDGESVLIWDIDFGFANQFKSKNKTANRKRFEPANFERVIKAPANYSRNIESKSKLAEETLYSTSFESSEGFSTGSYEGISEWRAVSDNEFLISSSNPKSGSQHLRIEGDGTGNTRFIGAPFFGYQQFGNYEITVNFSISSTDEVYDIYVFDGKNGQFTSAIIIAEGTFYAADLDEQDQLGFSGVPAIVTANQYHEIKMILDPDEEAVKYLFNGVTVAENSYVGGFTPGEMQILNRSDVNGSTIDVDNVEIKKVSAPFPWLSVPGSTGITLEDGSSNTSLQFTTKGIEAGTYRTNMLVKTNDPQNPEFQVPITLTVADMVPNETVELPQQISLSQNYPNPFNPSTNISYTLANSETVQLEVFNIQGQKVATLVSGKQQAGDHEVTFDASNLSSGVYIYRLQTVSQILTRQMVLIK